MKIKQKIKGTLSSVFNVLSGKKGREAALSGYAAVALGGVAVAFGVAGMPIVVGVELACAAVNAICAHKAAKKHDDLKKGRITL